MLINELSPRHHRIRLFEYAVGIDAVAPYDAVVLDTLQIEVGFTDTLCDVSIHAPAWGATRLPSQLR